MPICLNISLIIPMRQLNKHSFFLLILDILTICKKFTKICRRKSFSGTNEIHTKMNTQRMRQRVKRVKWVDSPFKQLLRSTEEANFYMELNTNFCMNNIIDWYDYYRNCENTRSIEKYERKKANIVSLDCQKKKAKL